MTTLALLSLLVWLYLLLAHGRFWQSGPELLAARPTVAPPVAVVVPARDEAPLIGRTLRSLLAQDYAGPLRIILVDDASSDGTGALARSMHVTAMRRQDRCGMTTRETFTELREALLTTKRQHATDLDQACAAIIERLTMRQKRKTRITETTKHSRK